MSYPYRLEGPDDVEPPPPEILEAVASVPACEDCIPTVVIRWARPVWRVVAEHDDSCPMMRSVLRGDQPDYCACGQLLHYTDPGLFRVTDLIVRALGSHIPVNTATGTWRVQRHYIALHGLAASDLPGLSFDRLE